MWDLEGFTDRSRTMKVIPVQARSDNWMYLVVDTATNEAAVVDPYDAPKLNDVAKQEGVKVCLGEGL